METLHIDTGQREEMIDITGLAQRTVRENGWNDGALLLYCPHTTGAITVKMGDMQYPEGG